MADWVELRVHGVSGTPPEDMLASAHVVQVAGDDRTRCFRPADTLGREVRGTAGQLLEAFHWGRWTSGSWAQALWLLLTPFGLVNAAQFMLPPPLVGPGARASASRYAHALCGAVLRLLALVLTVLFSVAAAVVVVDLVVWQWLARRELPVDDRVLVVAGLLVAAGIGFALSLLGRTRQGPAYRFRSSGQERCEPDGLPGLQSAAFFDGDPDAPVLRTLHRAAGLPVVSWLGLSIAASSRGAWSTWAVWIPPVLLGVIALVAVLLGDPERTTSVALPSGARARLRRWWHGDRNPAEGTAREGAGAVVARLLLALSAADLLLSVMGVATASPSGPYGLPGATGEVPGDDRAAAVVGIAGTGAVLLLLASVLVLSRLSRPAPIPAFGPFAGGMTAALAASVGFFVGIGFCAGMAVAAQGAVNRLSPAVPVDAPEVLQRVSYAWGITALVLLVAGAVVVLRYLRCRDVFRRRASAAMTFGADQHPRLPREWLARTATAMQQARLKNLVPGAFWLFALTGAVLSVAATYGYLAGGSVLTGTSSPPGDPVLGRDLVIGLGQLALVGLGGGLVVLARGALKAESARRGLNVVWDVIAFWPRSVHPYVPPPYAQVVVPSLVRRICWHLGLPDPLEDVTPGGGGDGGYAGEPVPTLADGDLLVLAGHSQGSLVSLVALLWLPPEARERVRWLTFGSQLRQQFPRAFPHYVTVPLLRDAAEGHRWLSLYRDTDPIAGPVTSWDHTPDGSGDLTSVRLTGTGQPEADRVDPITGRRECGDEWRLLDPVPSDVALQTGAVATVRGHGGYWSGPDWADAVARLVAGSVPDEQGDRQPVEQLAEADAAGVGDHAGAGQVVAPRSGGQRDGGVSPPVSGQARG
jgi:hypothetical protein